MDIKAFTEKMNEDLRKKSPGIFSDKTYTDEPIIKTASRISAVEPPEYREMRRMKYYSYEKGWSQEHIFYEQAKFMEAFEDYYDFKGKFSSYFPTYNAMSTEQLRGYFAWRTKVRKGITEQTQLSFAFVYMYEILNLIGFDSPESAFDALIAFSEEYRRFAPETDSYTKAWIKDFIAFYDLDVEKYGKYCDFDFENEVYALQNCDSSSDRELFESIRQLSLYAVDESPFYRSYPAVFEKATAGIFRTYSKKYAKNHKTSFPEKLLGSVSSTPYTVFGSAVFYDRTRVKNHTAFFNENCVYHFSDGQCICHRVIGGRGKSAELGLYIKCIDGRLREQFDFEQKIQYECPSKAFEAVLKQISSAVFDEYIRQQEAEKLRYVDRSLLDSIIKSSDKTREMLITEEEREDDTAEEQPAEPEKNENHTEVVPESRLPLNSDETGFLICLLTGGDINEFARSRSLKISLLCDAVNEKLYDEFYDTVLEFDGEAPAVIEDYAEELKEKLNVEM